MLLSTLAVLPHLPTTLLSAAISGSVAPIHGTAAAISGSCAANNGTAAAISGTDCCGTCGVAGVR
eukprot:2027422-Rhodomonas_salina.1